MRTFADRVRHTLMFEVIALILVATIGAWITGRSVETIGLLGLMFSALAMFWNFTFNWMFDHWERVHRNGQKRTVLIRVIHAVLFEAALLLVGIFLVAWWLDVTYWYAFMLDIGFSSFFLVYAFCFNWAYDLLFPARPSIEAC